MRPAVVAFWTDVLTGRTKSFVSGGMAAEPPYDHAGPSIRASEEVNGLLRDQGKIRQQFSGLLGATAIGRGAGSLPAELYWELLDANDQGVVTLGASYSRGGAGLIAGRHERTPLTLVLRLKTLSPLVTYISSKFGPPNSTFDSAIRWGAGIIAWHLPI